MREWNVMMFNDDFFSDAYLKKKDLLSSRTLLLHYKKHNVNVNTIDNIDYLGDCADEIFYSQDLNGT